MKTDVIDETQDQVEQNDEEVPLREEAASLVELTKNKVNRDNLTPCPSCTILVHIKQNHCPHCNSNIAANNALMRESLRRLGEIQSELDGEHQDHVKGRPDESKKSTFGERFRHFFSGSEPEEEVKPPVPDPKGPRILDTLAEGDQLKGLETCDPWYKVKTRDGKTGWVYSTLVKKP
jgi:hypothetical protein